MPHGNTTILWSSNLVMSTIFRLTVSQSHCIISDRNAEILCRVRVEVSQLNAPWKHNDPMVIEPCHVNDLSFNCFTITLYYICPCNCVFNYSSSYHRSLWLN